MLSSLLSSPSYLSPCFRCECCVTSSIFLSLSLSGRSCVLFIFKRPTKSPFTNCSFAVTRLTNKRILKYLSERSPSLSLSLSRLSKLQNQIRPPQALLRSDAANQPLKRSSFPLPLSPTHPHPHPHPTRTHALPMSRRSPSNSENSPTYAPTPATN